MRFLYTLLQQLTYQSILTNASSAFFQTQEYAKCNERVTAVGRGPLHGLILIFSELDWDQVDLRFRAARQNLKVGRLLATLPKKLPDFSPFLLNFSPSCSTNLQLCHIEASNFNTTPHLSMM